MRRSATLFLLLAGLLAASTAFAVDFQRKATVPQGSGPEGAHLEFTLASVLACDDGNAVSGYYQYDIARYGNLFTLPAGTRLSALEFAHFGFGFGGPYAYDIELWDPASCTLMAALNNLTAQDAADAVGVEQIYLCPQNWVYGGDVIVAIDANTCLAPNDCYPDLLFDDQINVLCPFIVDASSGACSDVSDQGGPFILRLEIDGCPVPTVPRTWGGLKTYYR